MKKVFLVSVSVIFLISLFTSCDFLFPPDPAPDLRIEVLRLDSYSATAEFITGFFVSNFFGDAYASSIQYKFNLYSSTGVLIPYVLDPIPADPGSLVYRFPFTIADDSGVGVMLMGNSSPYIPYSYDLTVNYNNFYSGKAMPEIYLSGSLTVN